MAEIREGGCLCGTVRYRVKGNPVRASVCHCTFCKRRTGSALGMLVLFDEENVEITGGPLTTYEHKSDESQRWIRMQFCPRCGTTVILRFERFPGACGVSAGTLDDPSWVKIERVIWTRSALPWMTYPPGIEQFEKAAMG
jgi:hypothetical protein